FAKRTSSRSNSATCSLVWRSRRQSSLKKDDAKISAALEKGDEVAVVDDQEIAVRGRGGIGGETASFEEPHDHPPPGDPRQTEFDAAAEHCHHAAPGYPLAKISSRGVAWFANATKSRRDRFRSIGRKTRIFEFYSVLLASEARKGVFICGKPGERMLISPER